MPPDHSSHLSLSSENTKEAECGEGGCEVAEPAETVAARRGLQSSPASAGSPLGGGAGARPLAAEGRAGAATAALDAHPRPRARRREPRAFVDDLQTAAPRAAAPPKSLRDGRGLKLAVCVQGGGPPAARGSATLGGDGARSPEGASTARGGILHRLCVFRSIAALQAKGPSRSRSAHGALLRAALCRQGAACERAAPRARARAAPPGAR